MKRAIVIALLAAGLLNGSALAQETMESVVVTGTRIDPDAFSRTSVPNIRQRVPADFVLFEATFVNSDLDLAQRKADLKKTFQLVRREDEKRRNIEILVGDAEESYPLESTTFEEAYGSYGQRGSFSIALRVDAERGETYDVVRNRVETFLNEIEEFGRVQYFMSDEQYIGLRDPERFRPELIAAISNEVNELSTSFAASEITVTGLDEKTVTLPTGALSLDVFIPYTLTIVSKR